MANRWAEEPETGEQTKSDLNPLLNPVLEENLGRWAQVYFTNPPEKRERAVMDLLRELEDRTGSKLAQIAGPQGGDDAATPAAEKVQCTFCNGENRLGQKFCGFCGSPIRAQQQPPRAESVVAPETMSFLGLSSAPLASAPPENDLAFLREKSFEKSYYEPESGSHRTMYIVAALMILAGGIAYLNWPVLRTHLPASWQTWTQTRVEPDTRARSAMAQRSEATLPQAAVPETTSALPPSQFPAAEKNAGNQPEHAKIAPAKPRQKSAPTPPDSSPHSVKLASDAHASPVAVDGTQELVLAQRYLHESSTSPNRAEAARWLWKSVGKQNPQAALLLADMYRRGDGVSKSCDQARILLGAAARKGLPDATVKLRDLESSGCR